MYAYTFPTKYASDQFQVRMKQNAISHSILQINRSADSKLIFRRMPVSLEENAPFWRSLGYDMGRIMRKGVVMAYSDSIGSGEPAHPRKLARTYAARLRKR